MSATTRAASAALIGRLTQHPQITTATITSATCPVQIEGKLADQRPYYFHARHGVAELRLGRPGTTARGTVGTGGVALSRYLECPDGLHIEMTEDVVTVFKTLLTNHSPHPDA